MKNQGIPNEQTMQENHPSKTAEKTPPQIVYQDQEFYARQSKKFGGQNQNLIMSFFMLSSDILCWSLSIICATFLWHQVRNDFQATQYLEIIPPTIICFVLVYLFSDLYPGVGLGPVEELRRLSRNNFFVLLAVAAITFYLRNTFVWSRAVLGLSWLLITISTPLLRKVFRRWALSLHLWGIPVAVIGNSNHVLRLCAKLRRSPLNGLWPVIGISAPHIAQDIHKIPPEALSHIPVALLIAGPNLLSDAKNMLLDKTNVFKRIIVILSEQKIGPLWGTPLHLVEHFGLEITHNLLNPVQRNTKRMFDLGLILLSIPFLIPFTLLIATLIKMDSPGPVFYRQKRVGLDGREIQIWKFRSMILNAEQELVSFLEKNPEQKKEWEQNFKLKNDPRITRIGHFLRRTSLDEFPQIWNILRGEMSIIGPRPIVREEIPLYGKEFEIYKKILPGLTGMWQVSGRNDVSYEERVNLDVYYVQNWSIWLDIHILLHTVIAVLQRRGAY